MKVWLLYPYTTPRGNNAFGWFREAFTRRGMELEVYFWGTPGVPKSVLISEKGDESPLDRHRMPDVVLIRGYNSGLSMWFEMRGKKVINCCKSMEWSRDKVATARLLEAAGLPTPKTLTYLPTTKNTTPLRCNPSTHIAPTSRYGDPLRCNPSTRIAPTSRYGDPLRCNPSTRIAPTSRYGLDATIPSDAVAPSYEVLQRDFGGQPFVMKLTFGSKGEDVYLIDSQEQYKNALAAAAQTRERRLAQYFAGGGAWTENGAWLREVEHGCTPLFQEYIPQSMGRDLRVWVVGGEVAGYVLRHNPSSFKSNFAQGGNASACALPAEAASLAIAATKCLGLDFAGVDLLFRENCTAPYECTDFTVCEINGNAGFRTSSLVGTMDIPDALAKLSSL